MNEKRPAWKRINYFFFFLHISKVTKQPEMLKKIFQDFLIWDCGVVCDRVIPTLLFGTVEWFVTGSSQLSCLGLDCGVVCDRVISTFLFGTGLWSGL